MNPWWTLALGLLAAPAWAADITVTQATEAVRRHVCFSRIWWGDPYARLGQAATVDLRIDGRTAYLWSEDLRSVPHVRRWADSYMVVARPSGPVVTQRSGYNMELLKGDPAFERERRRVYGAGTQRVSVELPTNCEPRFEPDGPVKTEMRGTLTRTLSTAIATWGKRPAKGRVRMTIARFNIDYPETFALREDTGEVWRIGLLSGDPMSHTGGPYRHYMVVPQQRGPEAIRLRRLIQRYGETRELSVR